MELLDKIKQELEPSGYIIEFIKKGDTSIVEIKHEGASIKFQGTRTRSGIYYVGDLNSHLFGKTKEKRKKNHTLIMSFFEEIAKKENCGLIQLHSYDVEKMDGYSQSPDKRNIQEKELIPKFWSRLLDIKYYLHCAMYDWEKNDVTFKLLSEKTFYYNGYKGLVHIEEENEMFYVRETNQEKRYKVETKKEVNDAFNEIMKKVIEKTRLRTLINPPRYHFEKLIKEHLYYDERETEKLFQLLSQWITPREIEEKSALWIKERGRIQRKTIEEFEIVPLFSHYMVRNSHFTREITIKQTKEEVYHYIEQETIKKLKKNFELEFN